LLWGREELPDLERWARQAPGQLTPLECSFVANSQRRARRALWLPRMFGLFVVAAIVGGLLYHAMMRARNAEAMAAQAELEQGRSASLHGEPEALAHLAAAYEHDPAPSTAFMLARALEPRLAEQARFASSFERMWSAAFSPDGRQIVTTDDLNAQLWDAQTHRLLFKLKHGDVVYHAVYDAGGTRVVTGCGDGAVRIWDTTSGALLREFRSREPGIRYYAVALSPDGRLVAGLAPRGAHVWDATTGKSVADLRDDAGSTFPSLAFSADGRWFAMSTGNDVSVFDTQTWRRTHAIPGRGIHSLSWDPLGSRLLTGSAKGDVSIWDVPSGERVQRLRGSGEAVDAVAFASNGHFVAAGSRDGDEQVWDAESAELVSHSNLRSKILSIEFDRTSSLLVTGSSNGVVNVNDVASGMPVTVLDGPTAVVRTAHFDPSSTRIVGASWDGTARIWNAMAPYRRWSSSPVADDCDLATSLEPDRRFLAISCNDRPTRIWDTARDQLVAELPSVTPAGAGLASAYPAVSVPGDRAAIAQGETVEIYELPSARLLRKIPHGAPVTAVAFAADGRDIVSGAVDGSLVVTRDNGTRIELPISSASIDVAGFLDGGRVVEVDAERHLRIYDIGGSRLADLETRSRVATLRMSADGRRLITVSRFGGKIIAPELWDVESYRSLAQLASEGQGQVYSARFVAGGQVITACGDGAARLWDGEDGKLRQTYRGSSRFLADATLSADGSMLIAGGGGGQLRFWETASGRPLWTMPAHRSDLVGVHVEGDDIVTRGFSGDVARWRLPAAGQVIEACARNERCAIVTHDEANYPKSGAP
jgi:WD40 repeat protein